MTPGPLGRSLAVVYAVIDAAVVIAPAVAVRATGARAGIEGEYDLDLLVASAVVGGVHAVVAWRRLVDEERMAERAIDVWIAAIDALVVLAFASTWLIAGVLLGFTDWHALLARRGAPVVVLWTGVAAGGGRDGRADRSRGLPLARTPSRRRVGRGLRRRPCARVRSG